MAEFYTLTRIDTGAYLGMTTGGRQFILLAYDEDGSAQDGRGRTLTGTYWAVCVPARPGDRDAVTATIDGSSPGEGWRVHADTFRYRRQARSYAELELDAVLDATGVAL